MCFSSVRVYNFLLIRLHYLMMACNWVKYYPLWVTAFPLPKGNNYRPGTGGNTTGCSFGTPFAFYYRQVKQ